MLLSTTAWTVSKPGWDSVCALLSAIGAYTWSGFELITAVWKLPEPAIDIPSRHEVKELIGTCLARLPDYGTDPVTVSQLSPLQRSRDLMAAAWILSLLRNLGLLSIDGSSRISGVSERAVAFSRSMGLCLLEQVDLIADWTTEGKSSADANKTFSIVKSTEEYRVQKVGLTSAIANRKVKSSLIIIKAMGADGGDRFLMQKSHAWDRDGAYWFIGGIMEPVDKSTEECAVRELCEELGVERPMIRSLAPLAIVNDKRISSRVGCLTEYEYAIFSVTLDSMQQKVVDLHRSHYFERTPLQWASFRRENRWQSWDEIVSSEHILNSADCVITAIEQLGVAGIPYSSTIRVAESIA